VTLYLTLVFTSVGVLVGMKGLEFLDAVAVAVVCCVFKTIGVVLHNRAWSIFGG
jgi:uncharacterized membrane protein